LLQLADRHHILRLDDLLHKITHRQYRTWQAWLRLDWGRPSRSDYYAAQVAKEVRSVPYMLLGVEHELTTTDMLIPFTYSPYKTKPVEPVVDEDQVFEMYCGAVGVGAQKWE